VTDSPDRPRRVRATPGFFLSLDGQLPAERGSDGRPSRADFEAIELLRAIEEFATGFDNLPRLIPGRDDYRVLISAGQLVFAYTIVGQLARDGSVELVDVEIDVVGLEDPDVDTGDHS